MFLCQSDSKSCRQDGHQCPGETLKVWTRCGDGAVVSPFYVRAGANARQVCPGHGAKVNKVGVRSAAATMCNGGREFVVADAYGHIRRRGQTQGHEFALFHFFGQEGFVELTILARGCSRAGLLVSNREA
jgi:hypothetical protein